MKYVTFFSTLMLAAIAANASQIKTVQNYDDIEVSASITEPNTLLLEGDRILKLKAPGNTLIDACNGKANCPLVDEVTGSLTFLPAPLYHTRAFTVNLMTEKGHFYNVRVNPKPMPSQTIVLKEWQKPVIRAAIPHTSTYDKTVVLMLRALANGSLPEGFTEMLPKKPVIYRSAKTELKLLQTVTGNDISGEVFELTNRTGKPLKINEAWFNWPKTKGVTLEKRALKPFEKTRLYRIS